MIYYGIIEDRQSDPLKIGRCKVRVFGVHTPNKADLPTDDLPWAMVMMPTTSASIDGIGSTSGLVEGSTVMVVFADLDQQIPIILGSLYSVPIKSADPLLDSVDPSVSLFKPNKPRNLDSFEAGSTTVDTVQGNPVPVVTGDGSFLQDSSGNPVNSGYNDLSKLVASDRCFALLRNVEGLASLSKDSVKIGNDDVKPNTILYAYKDSVGYAVGWGNRFLNSKTLVDASTVITKQDADSLLQTAVTNDIAKSIKRNLTVPVTQSMFDALCSIGYNCGFKGISDSDAWKALQSGNYKGCADAIPTILNGSGIQSSRRAKEKSLFLADGIPKNVKVSK